MHLSITHCFRPGFDGGLEKGVESVRALSVQTDVGEDGKRWRTVKCAARPRTDSAFTESLRNIIPLAMKGLLDIPEDEPLVSLGSYSVLIGGATYLEFDSRDQQKNACKYLLGHRDKIIEHLTVARTVVKTRESRVQHDMRPAGVGARAGPTGSRRGEASDEFSYRNPMRYGLN